MQRGTRHLCCEENGSHEGFMVHKKQLPLAVHDGRHQSLLNIKLAYGFSYNYNSQHSQRMLSYMVGSKRQFNTQACSFPDFLWFITQQMLRAATHLVVDDYNTRVRGQKTNNPYYNFKPWAAACYLQAPRLNSAGVQTELWYN